MAKRATKQTQIVVNDPPSRGIQILLSGPAVTMDHVRAEAVSFRRQHREIMGELVGGLCDTIASVRTDIADAEARLADAARKDI